MFESEGEGLGGFGKEVCVWGGGGEGGGGGGGPLSESDNDTA